MLNLGSLSIPLLYSIFEKKFHFIQYFKSASYSILLVAFPFLIWDAWFTSIGVWGFNSDYHLSFLIFKMPIEEWLFFLCIPYACLFTYEVIGYYFPNFKISRLWTAWVSGVLIILTSSLLLYHFGKWYTTINFMFFILLMGYGLRYHLETLRRYLPVFSIILVPFFIVNGVLTGGFTEAPVVFYDDSENMGFRLFTIPFEDAFYAFNLLFSVQLLFNFFKRKYHA
ncbi:lycopene cyclase domain-containing protein [Tamlana carrageenivorans]|uniref:Lycopene cyclase domain-containing protein n=1 Tax=Pseudotamlana carrageenivorans TaxID=2069432 RepID=A0A2I7SN92_9FLAO|nr:lycopene cyclase domain-containing protein [Tamlana carrageenivorans]